MLIFSVDPGTTDSGWVIWSTNSHKIIDKGNTDNVALLSMLRNQKIKAHVMVIEAIVGYGMRVGQTTFDTCKWMGKFEEAWEENYGAEYFEITRKEVKEHICHNHAANDAAINEALNDRFGGKKAANGDKKNPGPLHGVVSHMRSALAIAITYEETILYGDG